MKVIDAIKKRRSTREYTDKDIEFSKIADIVEAGQHAPNAGNLQNWKFIIVKDKDKRDQIAQASLEQYWMAQAPVMIVICSEEERADKYYGKRGIDIYNVQNCAAAAQNMLLTATDLGLASCWVAAFNENNIRNILSIPKDVTPLIVLTIGYSETKPQEKHMDELKQVIYFDEWDTTIKNLDKIMDIKTASFKDIITKAKELLKK